MVSTPGGIGVDTAALALIGYQQKRFGDLLAQPPVVSPCRRSFSLPRGNPKPKDAWRLKYLRKLIVVPKDSESPEVSQNHSTKRKVTHQHFGHSAPVEIGFEASVRGKGVPTARRTLSGNYGSTHNTHRHSETESQSARKSPMSPRSARQKMKSIFSSRQGRRYTEPGISDKSRPIEIPSVNLTVEILNNSQNRHSDLSDYWLMSEVIEIERQQQREARASFSHLNCAEEGSSTDGDLSPFESVPGQRTSDDLFRLDFEQLNISELQEEVVEALEEDEEFAFPANGLGRLSCGIAAGRFSVEERPEDTEFVPPHEIVQRDSLTMDMHKQYRRKPVMI